MDTQELADALFGDDPSKREKWYSLLKDPVFKPIYNYKSWDETRDHPLRKL